MYLSIKSSQVRVREHLCHKTADVLQCELSKTVAALTEKIAERDYEGRALLGRGQYEHLSYQEASLTNLAVLPCEDGVVRYRANLLDSLIQKF